MTKTEKTKKTSKSKVTEITFKDFKISPETLKVINHMNFKEPSEIQKKAIPQALTGHDLIATSKTGSGKTLVFTLPIIEKLKHGGSPKALVITPTRELAEQVSNMIEKFAITKKLKFLPIYGGARFETQRKMLHGKDVIVGTPGRILDHIKKETLRLGNISMVVLDEFDRLLDMGFKKDVASILEACPEERQTMFFSATKTKEIEKLTKKYTHKPVEISVDSYVDYSKLKQVFYDVKGSAKFSLLAHLLKKDKSKLTMVFCSTQEGCNFVTKNLNNNKIKSKFIHGGMPQNKRLRVLDEFHKKKYPVLVCTDVAARGLDIKGVTHIYNYDMPRDVENYTHRIGRTARAGKQGSAINIVVQKDYDIFNKILENDSFKIKEKEVPKLEKVATVKEFTKDDFKRIIGVGVDSERKERRERKEKEESSFTRRTKRRLKDMVKGVGTRDKKGTTGTKAERRKKSSRNRTKKTKSGKKRLRISAWKKKQLRKKGKRR